MHAAIVHKFGATPVYTETDKPAPPADTDSVQLKVLATGVHRLVAMRASGQHYSTKEVPHLPGVDCVAEDEHGARYYCQPMGVGVGTFQDYITVPRRTLTPLAPGLDPLKVAGAVNPAVSSWMALRTRTTELPKDFSVLVLGATTASGQYAADVARSLGAGKVYGAARSEARLKTLGFDGYTVLKEQGTDFSQVSDVDIVLDYLYGPYIGQLMDAIKPTREVQIISIGALAGPEATFKSEALRSKQITIRGSGFGAASFAQWATETPELVRRLPQLQLKPVKAVPLAEIGSTWSSAIGGEQRVVYVP